MCLRQVTGAVCAGAAALLALYGRWWQAGLVLIIYFVVYVAVKLAR